ncbi:PREDICTED: trichohyalin-like, partial [Amphimedon queenslandica]|uniref:Protein kinase domain-containing protein n=2 Tax=Amphimedon queenslandica TaxID=400682 RepID=A0AAN0JYT6_AMPQE
MLVISGGMDKNKDTLDDCWIFNIIQHSWIKLAVPHSVSKRCGHSLSVFIMSPHCVWIITAGGAVHNGPVTNPNIAMVTELVLDSNGGCLVGDTYDSNLMTSEEYKKKYQQQLQTGRRIWLEEYQKPRKGDTANIEQTVQTLMKNLEAKQKELEESKKEAQVFHQQMEQKEREEAEKDQEIRRYRHQLQKKDRKNQEALRQKDIVILEKDRELQEKDRELRESQDHWSINKDEVTLIKEELGRGSYAVVTVGIFRGLRVAV